MGIEPPPEHFTPARGLPVNDNRGAPRQRTLFATGKLTMNGREHICLVRNMSAGGVGIEHDLDLTLGKGVAIETRGLPQTLSVVRWIDGRLAGLVFLQPALVAAAVADARQVLRSPRFSLRAPVRLLIAGEVVPAHAIDIGIGGMKLALPSPVAPGTAAQVLIEPGGRALVGHVCWTAREGSGVRFAVPLASRELAHILDRHAGGADRTGSPAG